MGSKSQWYHCQIQPSYMSVSPSYWLMPLKVTRFTADSVVISWHDKVQERNSYDSLKDLEILPKSCQTPPCVSLCSLYVILVHMPIPNSEIKFLYVSAEIGRAAPLPIQLSARASGKAMKDGASGWAHSMHMGDPNGVQGLQFGAWTWR